MPRGSISGPRLWSREIHKRSESLHVRVTYDLFKTVEAAAKRDGELVVDWVRNAILARLDRPPLRNRDWLVLDHWLPDLPR